MDPRQRLDLQMILDPQAPLRLRELYPKMEPSGSEEVGEKPADTWIVVSPEGFRTELAFDRESGLLVRAGDLFLEDYREVEGARQPFRIRLGSHEEADFFPMALEIETVRCNIEVDASLFEKPVCFLSMGEPLYKEPERKEVGIPALEACVGVFRHPTDPSVTFTVTRQEDHLMLGRTGRGLKIEIKPSSETDYFIGFLQQEFHFVKDASGQVIRLEMGADREFKAERIDPGVRN